MDRYEFNRQLAEAARAMAEEKGTEPTLQRAVQMATDLITHCDLAGISVVHADRIETPAASHEQLRLIDEYQYEIGEGPCLDALQQAEVLVVGDLAHDPRWPRWGPYVARETGAHASMSFRLFTDGGTIGALNLYAKEVDAFDHEDLLEGLAVAAQATVALAATLEHDQLRRAITTRQMIGEAIGILRGRYGLSSAQAFGVLRRLSSTQNVKLHLVAREVVDSGGIAEPADEIEQAT